jgi:hypothetical protein
MQNMACHCLSVPASPHPRHGNVPKAILQVTPTGMTDVETTPQTRFGLGDRGYIGKRVVEETRHQHKQSMCLAACFR